MTGQDSPTDDRSEGIKDEVNYIIEEFAKQKDSPGVDVEYTNGGGVSYMYAVGQILVRLDYLAQVLFILWTAQQELKSERQEAEDEEPFSAERYSPEYVAVIAGVVLLKLDAFGLSVPQALELIDRALGEGIATPNHVLTVAGEVGVCPATEPQEVYYRNAPFPPACPGTGGSGVSIYVADTGLLQNDTTVFSWLADVHGDDDPNTPGPGSMPPIKPYTGHGTFVAGVARCMAPAAQIHVADVFKVAGSTLESDMVRRLKDALGRGVDVFHLSVAAPSRKDLPLIAFEAWLRLLRQYEGVVCVVAAGNSDTRRPCWPAAFSGVVSVGALAADWHSRAPFSNFGGWVDVYAPGTNFINAYTTGDYACQVAPYVGTVRKFFGMAQWSGTSFSTPVVTGLIAARMSRTGENATEAAAALLCEARSQAIPGVGAVLLPCCDQAGQCCEQASPVACRPERRCCAHQERPGACCHGHPVKCGIC